MDKKTTKNRDVDNSAAMQAVSNPNAGLGTSAKTQVPNSGKKKYK